MRTRICTSFGFGLLFLPLGSMRAQTVQLPELRVFSTTGAVLVPDRGSVSLGGVRRGDSRTVRRGIPLGGPVFGNRFEENSSSFGGTSVHATIIDLEEMDRQILAQAKNTAKTPRNELTADQLRIRSRAAFIRQNITRNAFAIR